MKYVKYIFGLLLIPILLTAQKPTEFSSAISNIENYEECGLPKIDELRKLGEGRARPTLSGTELFINKTHFRIHYTLSGVDAATTAYAESAGVYAEEAWSQLTSLGWYMPPPDGTNGGDSKYDIYIRDLAGYLGVCYDENAYTSPFPDGYTSWVEIINTGITYTRESALVTHEFGHGCQMRYSRSEQPYWWFYENTSVFMEDIVFDNANTLPGRLTGSTDDPLDNPDYPINRASGVYEYRGALWAHFLDEYYDAYDARTVRRIWELCGYHAGNYILKDIDSTLGLYYSSDFAKALGHYAIWRYFSGTRDEGRHYEEGSTYSDAVLLRTHTTYPASGNEGSDDPSGPGGCNYIAFSSIGSNRLTIYFDGLNGYNWSAYVLGISGSTSYEYKISLEPTQDTGRITIPGWDYSSVILIPVVTHWTSTASYLTYTYSATRSSADKNIAGEISDNNYTGFYITPNPARNEIRVNYFIPTDKSGKLKIYNANGQQVKTAELSNLTNSIIWNRDDNFGHRVTNGIYFIELSCGDKIIKQKVLLLD